MLGSFLSTLFSSWIMVIDEPFLWIEEFMQFDIEGFIFIQVLQHEGIHSF